MYSANASAISARSSGVLASAPRLADRRCRASPATRSATPSATRAATQSMVSATPGRLVHVENPCPADELGGVLDQCGRRPRHRPAHDARRAHRVRIVDPVVEASPPQCVVQVTAAVGGEHDDRRALRRQRCPAREPSLRLRRGTPAAAPRIHRPHGRSRRSAGPAAPGPRYRTHCRIGRSTRYVSV